MTGAW